MGVSRRDEFESDFWLCEQSGSCQLLPNPVAATFRVVVAIPRHSHLGLSPTVSLRSVFR
jgi:hypothetical protein